MTNIERNAHMREWRKTDAGIAYRISRRQVRADYERQRNACNLERRREVNRASRNKNRAVALEYRRTYHQEFGYKDKARKAVFTAIANGSLIRPEFCSDCGKSCKPDGHHHLGYEREYWLSVQWLCKTCHRKADA